MAMTVMLLWLVLKAKDANPTKTEPKSAKNEHIYKLIECFSIKSRILDVLNKT